MAERGVAVDHATVHRWAIKILPVPAAAFRRRKRPVGVSWRMNETYIKVADEWKYLYRAVDRDGDAIDFLLRAKRDCAAARCFLERAIDLHGVPEKIGIDKSGAKTATFKRVVRPMLGFKIFRCARALIAGIETMHMIRKGQLDISEVQASSAASQFYSLAF